MGSFYRLAWKGGGEAIIGKGEGPTMGTGESTSEGEGGAVLIVSH